MHDVPYTGTASLQRDPEGRTTPEELLAAAYAGCFTMQLSALLSAAGHIPQQLRTTAQCGLAPDQVDLKISTLHLEVHGQVEALDQPAFEDYVAQALRSCPLGQVVSGNVEIIRTARLLGRCLTGAGEGFHPEVHAAAWALGVTELELIGCDLGEPGGGLDFYETVPVE